MRLSTVFQAGALGALFTAVGLVACYNPDIPDGYLQCSTPEGKCPRGFVARTGGFPACVCVKPQGQGTGGAGGMGAGGNPGTGGAGGMCVAPIAQCSGGAAPGALCDAACQTGCGCKERCTFSGDGVSCVADGGGRLPAGEVCTGAAATDRCAPGHICLDEAGEACGKRCARYCSKDADCPAKARCTTPLVNGKGETTGVKVCDQPPETCDPTYGKAKCTRPDRPSTYGCYLMGSNFPNDAVCDCAASGKENEACEFERGCEPGLLCAVAGPNQEARCRRVCPLDSTVEILRICGASMRCVAVSSTAGRWGTCQ